MGKFVPLEKTFIAVTLHKDELEAFTYIKNAKDGDRFIYYIDRISVGTISGATILCGQFIEEFEESPNDALNLTPGGTNRIYWGENQNDRRISSYNYLTDVEKQKTRQRLNVLRDKFLPRKIAYKMIQSMFENFLATSPSISINNVVNEECQKVKNSEVKYTRYVEQIKEMIKGLK